MHKIKTYLGCNIYKATTENGRDRLDGYTYGAYLPNEKPGANLPVMCANTINELLDFINDFTNHY